MAAAMKGLVIVDYFNPQPCVIDQKDGIVEVTCRYCGQRFFFQKADQVGIIVGPKGAKKPAIIGYAHNVCLDKYSKDDDRQMPTK